MGDTSDTHSAIIEVDFPVPRQRVFDAWVQPELVVEWFAPPGFTITQCELAGVPGGTWHIEYEDPHGHAYTERGVHNGSDAPGWVSFTLTQVDGTFVGPETLVEVTLDGSDDTTHMRFEQSGFPSAALRDVNEEGWRECFGKLREVLEGVVGSS